MKQQLRERILTLVKDKNVKQLKSVIAKILGLIEYKGLYINYDECMMSNCDLYYVCEINEQGFINNISQGFSTLDKVKRHIDLYVEFKS